jgi:hypothetical protein
MARPFFAVASLAPAAALDQHQSGCQNRPAGLKLLEPGLQMAGDQSWVLGDFESRSGRVTRLWHYGYVTNRIRLAKQNPIREEIIFLENG